jgi:hypothetical protein
VSIKFGLQITGNGIGNDGMTLQNAEAFNGNPALGMPGINKDTGDKMNEEGDSQTRKTV